MIHSIRPKDLFALVPEQPTHERIVQMKIPRPPEPGCDVSLTQLELMCLNACLRITQARRIFEFGTFLGNTTLHLALNSPPDAKVGTLDLDEATCVKLGYPRSNRAMEWGQVPERRKILPIRGDSRTWEPDSFWRGRTNLIFIDGDHTREGVARDTRHACLMLDLSKKAAIVWHDYSNPAWPGVTDSLDLFSQSYKICHVGDTMLAVSLYDPLAKKGNLESVCPNQPSRPN